MLELSDDSTVSTITRIGVGNEVNASRSSRMPGAQVHAHFLATIAANCPNYESFLPEPDAELDAL